MHPADPVSPAPVLDGYKGLRRATWEWTFETGSHALRLIFGGLFDRFPRARVGLGHLGETLPFLLWRFDSRAGPNFYGIKLGKPPSQYFKDNFIVTTSGMCSAEPLNCTIAALGHERVMFAADYPFESAQEAGEFMDHVPLAKPVRDGQRVQQSPLRASAVCRTSIDQGALVVDIHAEMYRDRFRRSFRRCNSRCFTKPRK